MKKLVQVGRVSSVLPLMFSTMVSEFLALYLSLLGPFKYGVSPSILCTLIRRNKRDVFSTKLTHFTPKTPSLFYRQRRQVVIW